MGAKLLAYLGRELASQVGYSEQLNRLRWQLHKAIGYSTPSGDGDIDLLVTFRRGLRRGGRSTAHMHAWLWRAHGVSKPIPLAPMASFRRLIALKHATSANLPPWSKRNRWDGQDDSRRWGLQSRGPQTEFRRSTTPEPAHVLRRRRGQPPPVVLALRLLFLLRSHVIRPRTCTRTALVRHPF